MQTPALLGNIDKSYFHRNPQLKDEYSQSHGLFLRVTNSGLSRSSHDGFERITFYP
jgi:hypothetical protein